LVKHRAAFSHAPILGTAGRLFYLALPVLVASWLTGNWGWWATLPDWIQQGAWEVVIGLSFSDVIHWFLDGCPL
ncbi:MAG: hypothetical protein FJ006_13300, partial [Chloroflexi bacterium]|nr:hypothetical protein [Chloroflexota bacterium]